MNDAEDMKPDPALDAIRGKLMRFFLINVVFLILAVMVVVGAIVYKSMKKPAADMARPAIPGDQGQTVSTTLAIPQGARLVGATSDGVVITLDVELAGGERELRIHNAATGALIGRHRIVSE